MTQDEIDLTIGLVVTAVALGLLALLVLWSRRTIERIARGQSRSAREIAKDLRRGE